MIYYRRKNGTCEYLHVYSDFEIWWGKLKIVSVSA